MQASVSCVVTRSEDGMHVPSIFLVNSGTVSITAVCAIASASDDHGGG